MLTLTPTPKPTLTLALCSIATLQAAAESRPVRTTLYRPSPPPNGVAIDGHAARWAYLDGVKDKLDGHQRGVGGGGGRGRNGNGKGKGKGRAARGSGGPNANSSSSRSSSSSIQGSCPDMCPEWERYMRSGPGNNDFHWLETATLSPSAAHGKGSRPKAKGRSRLVFSHAAAIKDYKRADGTSSMQNGNAWSASANAEASCALAVNILGGPRLWWLKRPHN